MASFTYRNISEDLQHYAKAYRAYRSRLVSGGNAYTDWHAVFLESDDVRNVLASLGDHEPLRILGVGSGTGEDDSQLISQLLRKHPTIQTTVVEPGKDHIQHYQSLSSKDDLSKVTWDWRQQTWQEYREYRKSSSSKAPKFHFIFAIHALYYVGDLEQSVLDMISCGEDGGLIVTLLARGESSFVRMSRLIISSPFIENNSANVAKILKKHQIEFSETRVPDELEVTECFEKDDETTRLIIDFISHVLHFRETAPPDVATGFMKTLREISIKRGDGLFMEDGSSLLIVKK